MENDKRIYDEIACSVLKTLYNTSLRMWITCKIASYDWVFRWEL